ncbi:hypothetical protein [Streptomyces sp. H39-C1]|uniref:hypothetical protein n=1 Tax=Streptomyces sp. H39-C1 TaxID=3004355 RepID=UPI0022AE70FF|nr:hypothetical protein [Streptomyces sp. H39-C1]MCZ4101021.1 hypothetical protein [Streptomyces sp. H39-C1]
MSTTAAPAPAKTTDDTYAARGSLAPLLATVIAVAATVLALFDLFANGLWPTCLHFGVGLAVFGAVRLCVGLALDPFIPTDDPEIST